MLHMNKSDSYTQIGQGHFCFKTQIQQWNNEQWSKCSEMLCYVTLPCYRRAPVPGPGRGRAAGGGVGQPGLHHHHLLQGEHAAANEFSQQFHEYLLTPLLNMAHGAAVDMVAVQCYPLFAILTPTST